MMGIPHWLFVLNSKISTLYVLILLFSTNSQWGIPVIIKKLHTVWTLFYRDVHTLASPFQICEKNRDENFHVSGPLRYNGLSRTHSPSQTDSTDDDNTLQA